MWFSAAADVERFVPIKSIGDTAGGIEMGAVRVLVIGGGVAGLEGMLALRALAGERVSICVIAPEEDFVYRPLAVAEPFHVAEMRTIALRSLVSSAGAELISARVTAVDAQQHVVRTQAGSEIPYDFLLVTGGTTPHEAVPGSLTFRGPRDQDAFADLLDAAVMGRVHRIIFALPSGVSWILPLYELALLTAEYLGDRGTPGIEISIVTPEESPLSLFGIQASEAVRELLEVRGIGLRTHTTPVSFENGVLGVLSGEKLAVDQVVSLPRLEGAHIDGLPYESAGFVRTDGFGHVDELPDVFAAGDITGFPIKQGGIAAQQADAVAETIAAHAGAEIAPTPFTPVLRGLLLTGVFPRFLYAEPGAAASKISTEALWLPPAKVAGTYLAPFLARNFGLDGMQEANVEGVVPV